MHLCSRKSHKKLKVRNITCIGDIKEKNCVRGKISVHVQTLVCFMESDE